MERIEVNIWLKDAPIQEVAQGESQPAWARRARFSIETSDTGATEHRQLVPQVLIIMQARSNWRPRRWSS